ncbi:MAG: hypothetical protein ACPGQQ_02915 [Candidatus Puniceispirillaceae bacterium]
MRRKDVKKLVKDLRKRGWTVTQGRGHYKAEHPKGGFIFMSLTPSDHHAVANMQADVRRLERQHRKAHA